jgi:serine/alanine adding enzyme
VIQIARSHADGHHGSKKPPRLHVSRISSTDLHEFCRNRRDVSIFQSGYAHDLYSKAEGCSPAAWKGEDESGAVFGTVLGVKFKESRLVPPFLSSHVTVRGGPVLSNATGVEDVSRSLLSAVTGGCKDALYVRCYPTPLQFFPARGAEAAGFVREKWLNVSLDLEGKSMEQLEKGLRSDKRRGIKRAQRSGVDIGIGETTGEMDVFYRLLEETANRRGFRLQDKSLFEAVGAEFIPRGIAKLLLARMGEETIAGRLVLLFNGIATDWYAASTDEANKLYANDLLVWKAIEWTVQNGGRCYDLGGAGRSLDEYGVGQFKERFGGETVDIGRYTWTRSPTLHGVVNRAEQLRSRVMRRSR